MGGIGGSLEGHASGSTLHSHARTRASLSGSTLDNYLASLVLISQKKVLLS